jgi:hypothetical protein
MTSEWESEEIKKALVRQVEIGNSKDLKLNHFGHILIQLLEIK